MEQDQFDVETLNFPEPTTEATPVAQEGNDKPVTETPSVPETPVETVVAEPVKVETTPEIKISDPPSKYEGESDIQFNLRKQIFDAGQAKAQAESPEEKSELAKHIKGLRTELAKNHKSEPVQPAQRIETSESQVTPEQSEEELAKEALRKMGYVSKDEIEAMVNNLVATKSTQDEHLSATREFYSSHKDIAANPAQREALERFVVEKFNITPQSTKQDLMIAMDMARGYLFPKNDTRAQRATESASKRDILNVSSNTQSVPTTSKVDEKLQAGLKDAGLTDAEMGW